MNEATLVTQNQAAALLDVRPHTIGELVRAWGITPKPMSNGRAHGLDKHDLRLLRKALNRSKANATAS